MEVWTLIIQKSTMIPPSPMVLFYENNVCFGLKVKTGTSYSKLSVNLLEAAASYYQLVTEDWLWGKG